MYDYYVVTIKTELWLHYIWQYLIWSTITKHLGIMYIFSLI